MSDPVVVVGTGPSGLHFAQSVAEKGRRVVLLDVGGERTPPVMPGASLNGLKRDLEDPIAYFLGHEYEAVILPGHEGEYYGFPPSKSYVFEGSDEFAHRSDGFAPLFSFAAGGLAEAWTGGCYPFDDRDLAAFPFTLDDLLPFYERVARRIGVTGCADDLAPFLPVHDALLEPLPLDAHSGELLRAYDRHKHALNTRHGFFLGHSRSAVLSSPLNGRPACDHLGRCLWGCPTDAFYTPSITLRTLRESDLVEYVPRMRVTHFRYGGEGRITHVLGRIDGREQTIDVGTLVLAAGALGSSRIFLESLHRGGDRIPVLSGLMDNRQVLMPFANTRRFGAQYEPDSFQYHQLAAGIAGDATGDYVHGLITTLKTALIHPVVQRIPTSLGTAVRAFRDVRAGLGLLNVNFADAPREGNTLTLDASGAESCLHIHYRPTSDEGKRIAAALSTFRRVLRKLGCVAPRGMTHVRPMGASVHYSGTLPMQSAGGQLTTDEYGRSRDFENLYIADGATFPSLPAKNLTFTLMANAARIAEHRF